MTTPGISILRAGPERIPDLEPLYATLHEHHATVAPKLAGMPARTVSESWRRRRVMYESWLASPGAFVLIAERHRTLVGYAVVAFADGFQGWASGDRLADVHELVVVPEERGRGLGTALMDAVERDLAAAGVAELRLTVISRNLDALRFYQRRGLAPVSHILLRRIQAPIAAAAGALHLTLLPDRLAIHLLASGTLAPGWLNELRMGWICSIGDERALVYPEKAASAGEPVDGGWRALYLVRSLDAEPSDPSADLMTALADARVGAVPVSVASTRCVLVREGELNTLVRSLQKAGHTVSP